MIENIWKNITVRLLKCLKIVVVFVGVVSEKKTILDEFEKKGLNSFNSSVKSWKLIGNLNKFEIFPLDPFETIDS